MISSKALDGSWPIGHASAVLCWATTAIACPRLADHCCYLVLFAADRLQKKLL